MIDYLCAYAESLMFEHFRGLVCGGNDDFAPVDSMVERGMKRMREDPVAAEEALRGTGNWPVPEKWIAKHEEAIRAQTFQVALNKTYEKVEKFHNAGRIVWISDSWGWAVEAFYHLFEYLPADVRKNREAPASVLIEAARPIVDKWAREQKGYGIDGIYVARTVTDSHGNYMGGYAEVV